jgi:putative acyl-CoA dehydrogenase
MTDTPFPNQPPPYAGRNLYRDDAALAEGVAREGARGSEAGLDAWGARMGSAQTLSLGDAANSHPPELRTIDARGERADAIEFHPAWHELMRVATAAGEHCAPWADARPGAHVARAAMYLMHAEVENGTQCPLTMTFASVPALRRADNAVPDLESTWLERIIARDYDPRDAAPADKRALLIGMGMTERQGGSDVRTNRSRAERDGDGGYRIDGHKWFFSAPQCDAHLVLAQAAGGLTCFLLPRVLPDGTRNAVRLARLKDKIGNRSNASSEVDFDRALAWRVGAEGRGIATILEMVQHTRLDCAIGSAGLMRACVARACHHARHRVAFGRTLTLQPAMRAVLADIALESEAATAVALRLARAFEAKPGSTESALARVATPAAKYWICKRAVALSAEAIEVLGGNGYVEENGLARFYREAPVNSIWEGSGNVMALDVLRALGREADARDALVAELAAARGADRRYDAFVAALEADLAHEPHAAHARALAQRIALALGASILVRGAPAFVADAFCASRLVDASFAGATFGTLPSQADSAAIVARALPD